MYIVGETRNQRKIFKIHMAAIMDREEDGPTFSVELLSLYYKRLFPYDHMFKWLSYGNEPTGKHKGNVKDFFYRREWSFTLADDVYVRYNCFHDASEMKAAMVKKQPHKIDIGAVFNMPPKDHLGVSAGNFKTAERELVFDIDLTDYDDVRNCCSGAKICHKCWGYMTMAIKCLDPALKQDFGFKHLTYIYSGRRGVHCWVSDPGARALTNEARTAVVDYLGVNLGSDGAKKTSLTWPPHPSIKRSYEVLKPLFEEHIAADEGQAIFDGEARWKAVLATLPEGNSVASKMEQQWSRKSDHSSSSEKWEQLEEAIEDYTVANKQTNKRAKLSKGFELEKWRLELVLTHCYPRLDENVSKMQNHLLKSPFCVHPKTGRVCVPIDVSTCNGFDPMAVPTLASLVREINEYDKAHPPPAPAAAGAGASEEEEGEEGKSKKAAAAAAAAASSVAVSDIDKTSMGPYMKQFEKSFLTPLYSDLHKSMRDEAELEAAAMGEF